MLESAMEEALKNSLVGVEQDDGGPFGAAVVKDNKIISVAHNTVLRDKDPTCHAEVNAIRKACQVLNTHVLSDCELYTTVEPCPMCLATIYWARIPKIYAAVSKPIAAKYGFDDVFIYDELDKDLSARHIPCDILHKNEEVEKIFKRWKDLGRELY